MAILLQNNLDVGPAGTTISVANSDDNGDDPFDVVDSAGSGVSCKYVDAVDRPTAAFVAEFATGNSARSPSCDWSTALGQQTNFYLRFYARYNTTPPTGYASPILAVSKASTLVFTLGVMATDNTQFWMHDELTDFYAQFYLHAITIGEWVRFEANIHVVNGGTSSEVWNMDGGMNFGDDVDSEVPAPLQTVTSSFGFPGSPLSYVDTVAIGYPVSHAHYEPVQVSGFAVSTDGWIGPAPRQQKGWPNIQPRTLAARHDSSW